jgi:hypothetical protein
MGAWVRVFVSLPRVNGLQVEGSQENVKPHFFWMVHFSIEHRYGGFTIALTDYGSQAA